MKIYFFKRFNFYVDLQKIKKTIGHERCKI
jgi:hypothetical protein